MIKEIGNIICLKYVTIIYEKSLKKVVIYQDTFNNDKYEGK